MYDLEKRMRGYEIASLEKLDKSQAVVVRVDGVAFKGFAQGLMYPFDDKVLLQAMRNTMLDVCKWLDGVVFAYTQSDEITFVIYNSNKGKYEYSPFYDYRREKLTSVIAGKVSVIFWRHFENLVQTVAFKIGEYKNIRRAYYHALLKAPCFDCKVFNVPVDDVSNNILWRQEVNINNSVNQVCSSAFSHSQLEGKNINDRLEMLKSAGKDWNDLEPRFKYGVFCYRKRVECRNRQTCKLSYKDKFFIDTDTVRILDTDRSIVVNCLK